ncbi:LOW QUALITY PROTEIN: hypothetical protein, conserved [Eimeria necatrix]|uniref:KH domain-containing protein n=1 Tax=Eimeria necatrix TaxID=51315 RepID=U6MMC7_9EIME|nr:LOW QUALITY PROTEIN: hypothetical protein, conserved [Eimeria necatrix]CDJ62810.1 hypothetical protein, conserved [Eimeria necatrix]
MYVVLQQPCLPTSDFSPSLKKVPVFQSALQCSVPPHHAMDSSATEAPLSPSTSQELALVSMSMDSQGGTMGALQDSDCPQTPVSPSKEGSPETDSSIRITPKGTKAQLQPKVQQQAKSKEELESEVSTKPAASSFCLSANAPPYTPQSTAAKETLRAGATAEPDAVIATSESGTSPPSVSRQHQDSLQLCDAGSAPVNKASSAPTETRALRQADPAAVSAAGAIQAQPDTVSNSRKIVKPNSHPPSTSVPLKFCKFLIGEDVAGFLVGRKGVGIEEFQTRNGPGLKVSVSKRGELFPCLLERTATAVGVGDGVERALLEVSKVALDRAMHKEEERRIDNGKKICKPKGCFKLVVPDSALTHIFTPDSEGRVPVVEVAKKHGVEILSSAEGGHLHNKMHHLGMKETVLQVIGNADLVPRAVVDLSLLYQGDPSLPSSLHLNYSHAHFVAAPPPPPTPPPSPALSSACGNRMPPYFAHPAGLLHLASGCQQQFVHSNGWSATPQAAAPLLHALRASGSSQTSMLCMPSTLSSTDNSVVAPSQTERLMGPQMQGFQGQDPAPYALSSSATMDYQGGRHNNEKAAHSSPSLTDDGLVAELKQRLGAAVVAAAAANATAAQSQPCFVSPDSQSAVWSQQQQFHEPQQHLVTGDCQDLQLLSQLCATYPRQALTSREQQQQITPLQNGQPGLLQQLDELQQSRLQQQMPQAPHQHPHQLSSSHAEDLSALRSFAPPSSQLSLQQLQSQLQLQLQMLQLQQNGGVHLRENGLVDSAALRATSERTDEQKKPVLLPQHLQRLQQYLQQQLQQNPQQTQSLQSGQLYSAPDHGDVLSIQLQAQPQVHATPLHDQHHPLDWSESRRERLQELRQLHDVTLVGRAPGDAGKPKRCGTELPQHQSNEDPLELLSPVPPPYWAQISQQQQAHQSQQQNDWRLPIGSSQCSPSATSPDLSLQLPQQPSASLIADVHQHFNGTLSVDQPPVAASALNQSAAAQGSLQPVALPFAQTEERRCDPLAVRKLLEELLKIMSPSTGCEAPIAQCSGAQLTAFTQTAKATPAEGAAADIPKMTTTTQEPAALTFEPTKVCLSRKQTAYLLRPLIEGCKVPRCSLDKEYL